MNIKDLKFEKHMTCHIAMKTYHLSKYECKIICPGNMIDGKVFYQEVKTRKGHGEFGNFGKSESVFYFDLESKMYKSVNMLLESIGIKTE
jgi:hypothetical protein